MEATKFSYIYLEGWMYNTYRKQAISDTLVKEIAAEVRAHGIPIKSADIISVLKGWQKEGVRKGFLNKELHYYIQPFYQATPFGSRCALEFSSTENGYFRIYRNLPQAVEFGAFQG